MRAGRWLAVVLAVVALPLGSGGALAADHLVRITSGLSPATITIAPGDSLIWRNDDSTRHRMRSTSGPDEFDSGDIDPGESYMVTLTAVGTYSYRDERDRERSSYWGTIVVAEPGAGGSGTPSSGPNATPGGGTTIAMAGRVFRPSSITITAGTTVTWRNNDDRDHTATSSSGAFDSGTLAPGRTYARTFPTAGSFPFLCVLHPDMRGVVNVLGANGATAPPPTPAPPTAPPAAGPTASAVGARIVDFAFDPGELRVPEGTTVSWVNAGVAPHTVTARDGSFDSAFLAPGATWQRVFSTAGTYEFLCTLHPSMTGSVVVTKAAPGGPSPQPAPTAITAGVAGPVSSASTDPPVDADPGPLVAGVGQRGQSGPAFLLAVVLALLLCLVALGAYGMVLGDVIRRAER